MKSTTRLLLCVALFALCTAPAFAATDPQVGPASDPAAASRIAWWRDAKFGLFMHFGVYSILGKGEWVQWREQIPVDQYAKLADQFNPQHLDPDAWAKVAADAGMKYTVLTTRHHDGFALFDDPQSNFTAMKSAAHRDIVADYVKAVRKAGLRVGLYYSPLDWRFPGFFFPDLYRPSAEDMRAQYHRQIQELCTNYGPIDLLWFDGGGVNWLGFGGVQFGGNAAGWHSRPKDQSYHGGFSWQDDQVYAQIRKLQPQVIINNRIDAPYDYFSREGDAKLGDFDDKHPWELCTTIAGSWGWTPNAKCKTPDQVIQLLVKVVGRDGNLLLNVGPKPDGQIEPDQVKVLAAVGDWLQKYGDSIYNTRGGPFLPGDYGVSTFHDKTVYIHILDATKTTVELPALTAKVVECSLLTGGTASFDQSDQGIKITLQPGDATAPDLIVKLDLDSVPTQP